MRTLGDVGRVVFVVGAVVASLASASSTPDPQLPTPYQPYGWNGGYWTNDLGNGLIEISVKGNAYTEPGTVLSFAYRRANEMCPSGHVVVDGTNGRSTSTVTESSARAGNVYGTTIARGTSETTTYSKPSVTLIIRCKTPEPKPVPRRDFDSQTNLPTELEKRE